MQIKVGRKSFRMRLEQLVSTLREQIVTGHIPVGGFLPSENSLEEQFHLSNNSVRKGLDILVQEGLIEKIPCVGNRILPPSTQSTTVIKFGYHKAIGSQTEMNRLIEMFHKQYPHIKVQPLELPTSNFYFAIEEYMKAGLLDVVTVSNNRFQDFIENGSSDLFEPLQINEDIYPFLSEPFMKEGQLLAQPFVYSPLVLCYNREHFQQKHIPEPDSSWSWHDLSNYVKRLAGDKDRFGFYFHLHSLNRWPIFLLQSGLTPSQDSQQRSKKIMENMEICKDLLSTTEPFPMLLTEGDVEELFVEEKVSVILTTYFFLNALKHTTVPFDIAPVPSSNDPKTLLIIVGLAVNSKSDNKEAAKLFSDFLNSYDTQLFIRQNTLNIPAHQRVDEVKGQEQLNKPSRFFMYREIMPSFRLLNDLGLRNSSLRSIQKELVRFISGLQDSAVLCSRIEQCLVEDSPNENDIGKQ
jgi:multiple sugar transport system substrate-binding protein